LTGCVLVAEDHLLVGLGRDGHARRAAYARRLLWTGSHNLVGDSLGKPVDADRICPEISTDENGD
jgi:hypothetical protein